MSRIRFVGILLLVLSFLTLFGVQAQENDGLTTITGTILDAETGLPISGAIVSVDALPGVAISTNRSGNFVLPDIAIAGDYTLATIAVRKAGYGNWTMRDTPLYPGVTRLLPGIQLTQFEQFLDGGGLPTALRDDLSPEAVAADNEVLLPAEASQSIFSHEVIPQTIRVGITGHLHCRDWLNDGQPIIRVEEMPFSDYVKNVLPNEWVSTWEADALRAGAMAVKMFAWWRINLDVDGIRPGGAHVVDNTCDQVYRDNSQQSTTSAAVDDTWNHIMRSNGRVVEIHYLNTDENCERYFTGYRCMGQWGSQYMVQDGYTWQDILHRYYDPVEITLGDSNLPVLTADTDIVRNGSFNDGFSHWYRTGDASWAVYDGVLAFKRDPGGSGGRIFQSFPYTIDSGSTLEILLELGNSSGVTKTPTIRLGDSSSTLSCQFVIPPNTPPQPYLLRGTTNTDWSIPRLEVLPDPADGQPDLLMDNVALYQRDSLTVAGTQCFAPDSVTAWNFANGPQDWTIGSGLGNPRIQNASTAYDITGEYPVLHSPYMLDVSAEDHDLLTIQMASSADGCGRVYFQTSTQTGFSADQYVAFDVLADSLTHTYYVEMNVHAGWQGQITRLRLDPRCDNNNGGILRIGSIALADADATLRLLQPALTTDSPYGNPVYQWTHTTGAESYRLLLAAADGSTLFDQWLPALSYCDDTTCTVDLTQVSERARLFNGDYTLRIQPRDGEWAGPFAFTLIAPPPAAPTLLGASGLDSSRPTLNWQLDGDAAFASWFRVLLLAPNGDSYTQLLNQWVRRVEACGSANGTTCSFNIPLDLVNGDYTLYIRAAGPGGLSGGAAGGFAGPYDFEVNVPPPLLPANLSAIIQNNHPLIGWDDDPNAAWFNVLIVAENETQVYAEWLPRTSLCDGTRCTLIPDVPLANGLYRVFVRAWGAGGLTTGGLNGWGGPTSFTIGMAAPEPVVPLPPANVNSGRPTFMWNASPDAQWYQIWVGQVEALQQFYFNWHSSDEMGCTDVCTLTPDINLPNGDYTWYIQAWGAGGLSEWSIGEPFTVAAQLPGTPEPITPTDLVTSDPIVFQWEPLPDVVWYNIEVAPAEGTSIHQGWYSSVALGCNLNGVCSVVIPDLAFTSGSYQWRLQGYTPAGVGAWSGWRVFTVP